jgi:hypothetical protein
LRRPGAFRDVSGGRDSPLQRAPISESKTHEAKLALELHDPTPNAFRPHCSFRRSPPLPLLLSASPPLRPSSSPPLCRPAALPLPLSASPPLRLSASPPLCLSPFVPVSLGPGPVIADPLWARPLDWALRGSTFD